MNKYKMLLSVFFLVFISACVKNQSTEKSSDSSQMSEKTETKEKTQKTSSINPNIAETLGKEIWLDDTIPSGNVLKKYLEIEFPNSISDRKKCDEFANKVALAILSKEKWPDVLPKIEEVIKDNSFSPLKFSVIDKLLKNVENGNHNEETLSGIILPLIAQSSFVAHSTTTVIAQFRRVSPHYFNDSVKELIKKVYRFEYKSGNSAEEYFYLFAHLNITDFDKDIESKAEKGYTPALKIMAYRGDENAIAGLIKFSESKKTSSNHKGNTFRHLTYTRNRKCINYIIQNLYSKESTRTTIAGREQFTPLSGWAARELYKVIKDFPKPPYKLNSRDPEYRDLLPYFDKARSWMTDHKNDYKIKEVEYEIP